MAAGERSRVEAYLERAPDGTTFAHVLALPGCFARGADRATALAALPAAARRRASWMRARGFPSADLRPPIGVVVREEQVGRAPVEHGDPAALFGPEREPLGREDLEGLLRVAAAVRAETLALVAALDRAALDRARASDGTMVGGILRHVGNAGEWYVSRLVPAASLPMEWDGDAEMPLPAFLAMEGRTAAARLRGLTDAELAAVVHPERWTAHPDEPWSARKALRRRIEHEVEHLAQVRHLLARAPGT